MSPLGSVHHSVGFLDPASCVKSSAPDLQLQRRLQLAEPWAVALGLLTAASPLQLVLTLK